MLSYKDVIKEVSSKTYIPKEHIFDFEGTPMHDVCKSFYDFYSEALDRNKDFGIEPSLLFFNTDRTLNASAGLYNGYNIIQFNIGIIDFIVRTFKDTSELLVGTENDEFIEFEKVLDVPINELMYQNVSHFTFYHELGHLVQKSKLLEDPICEFLNSKSDYSELNHLLELDADKFSAICIGTHVFQYLQGIFGDDLSKEKAENTLILICSSALFYILSFSSNKLDIYYREKSHPHPVIRISCIVFHIISYVKQSLDQKGFEIELNGKDIIRKCILFSHKIYSKKLKYNYIEDYIEILESERNNISQYIKYFESLQKKDETLAVNKWNIRAENISTSRIFRSFSEPKREGLSWDERWKGNDRGLITCWEVGRVLRGKEPEQARRAEKGELPVLGWKGGVAAKTKKGNKYGTFNYLAQWQGLRGENLNIDFSKDRELVCSKTGTRVVYTTDCKKNANQ